jgi:hypothetical protein
MINTIHHDLSMLLSFFITCGQDSVGGEGIPNYWRCNRLQGALQNAAGRVVSLGNVGMRSQSMYCWGIWKAGNLKI